MQYSGWLSFEPYFSATWALSAYLAYHRTWKPFNPILGETYEMVNHQGITFIAEQVSDGCEILQLQKQAELTLGMVIILGSILSALTTFSLPSNEQVCIVNIQMHHLTLITFLLISHVNSAFCLLYLLLLVYFFINFIFIGKPSSSDGCSSLWERSFYLRHHIKVEDKVLGKLSGSVSSWKVIDWDTILYGYICVWKLL